MSAEDEAKREWRGPIGWLLLFLGVLEKILGWGGNIDFVVSRSADPGWLKTLVEFFVKNLGVWCILLGVLFIVWNERRRTDRIVTERLGRKTVGVDSNDKSDDEVLMSVIGRVYHSFGNTVGSDSRLQYDLALADSEHVLLAMAKHNSIPLPELRRDGTPARVYRALAFLNEIIPALRINDPDEIQRRARASVPVLNSKSAADLHEEIGLPHYSMPPD